MPPNIVRAAGNTNTVIDVASDAVSRGAIGGTPGYNDDEEQDADSYSWPNDRASSVAADVLIRAALIAGGFGAEQLPSADDYGFPVNNPDNADDPGNGP